MYRLLAPAYRLPLLWLDWSGARARDGRNESRSVITTSRSDGSGCVAATTKGRAALWVDLPDGAGRRVRGDIATTRGPRSAAPLFPGVHADRLRTAIGRACRAAAVPVFSPHSLRHRRISLLAPAGPKLGRDRPVRRAAQVVGDGRHVHARNRRRRTRLRGTAVVSRAGKKRARVPAPGSLPVVFLREEDLGLASEGPLVARLKNACCPRPSPAP